MMRRIVSLAIISLVLVTSTSRLASSQSNHSLEWGVEIGDEIHYLVLRKTMDPSFQEYIGGYAPFLTDVEEGQRVIARVDHLGEIPAQIDDSRQMPSANCTLLRFNDSEVIMEDMPMMVMPAGDWDFISENMNLTWSEEATAIDTEDEWGYSIASSFLMGIIPISFSWEMRYIKGNGTMSLMSIAVQVAGSALIDIALALWDPDLIVGDGGIDILFVALSVSAAVIVFVFVALVLRRRKGLKLLEPVVTHYE